MMPQDEHDPREQLPIVLTVKDIQRLLRISRAKAYDLTHKAGFPCVRIGRTIRIPRDAFLAWLTAQASQEDNII